MGHALSLLCFYILLLVSGLWVLVLCWHAFSITGSMNHPNLSLIRHHTQCLVALGALLFTANAYAQTELSFQDGVRPLGLDTVGPVMLAGSDEASADFQDNSLPELLNFVNENLSERQALADIAAVSLDPEALVMHNESSVRVYFMSEGAGYRNTLGYTTENLASGETSEQQLIFPDASSWNLYRESDQTGLMPRNNVAPLQPGDFVDLGLYGPSELVDFFLISNGANGNTTTFTASAEQNPDMIQHVVAFALEDSPYLVIGFEDLYGGGDMDYNDLVFAVDIGATNVNYLANPEPAFLLMATTLALFGICHFRRGVRLISEPTTAEISPS